MKQVVSFSGGKDSTAMLLWLLEHKEPVDDVVFFDTGWEFPEMYDHLKKVEDYTGIKINIIKPSESFTFMLTQHRRVISRGKYKGKEMIGYGFPSFSTRWCTGRKQDAMNKYFMQYKQSGVTNCIGYAADEPKRFGNLHDTSWQKYRYPLVEAGMVEADALKYCYERGFDWGGGIQDTNAFRVGVVPCKTNVPCERYTDTTPNYGVSLKTGKKHLPIMHTGKREDTAI